MFKKNIYDKKILGFSLIIGLIIGAGSISANASTINPIYPWSVLGQDNQRTSYSQGTAPNNASTLWKTNLIHAGPITIKDGRVFFSSYNETEAGLIRINSYYENNGTIIWSKTIRWVDVWPPSILPSLTISENKIYFTHGGLLYCFDASSGWEIWEISPTPVRYSRILSDSPVIDGLIIFVTTSSGGSDEYCYALDTTNGTTIWRAELKGIPSLPTISEGTVLINSYDYRSGISYTECFNKENGVLLWRYKFIDLINAPKNETVSNAYQIYHLQSASKYLDTVFVALGSSVYALNHITGDIKWHSTISYYVTTTPTITYNNVFVASTDGYLYSLDQNTGELVWKYPLVGRVTQSLGCIATADNKIYVSTGDPAVLYCLNETDGKLIWQTDIGNRVYGLCVADGNLYVSADGFIYAFGSNSISTQSSISLEIVQTSPTVLPIQISGSINPPRDGIVEIQWSVDNNTWYSKRVAALNGLYGDSWIPPCNETFYMKALWSGDNIYSGSTSRVKSIVFGGEIARVQYLQSQISSLQNDKNDLQSQISSLQNDKKDLQFMTSSLLSDNQNLQSQVTSLQDEKIKLQIGTVAIIALFFIGTIYLFTKRNKS
jgi:outer membrane protein assembly factor BamB